MNTIKSAIISLIAATTGFAENPQFEIEARYEGFDPSFFAGVNVKIFGDVNVKTKNGLPDGVLAAPRVTAKVGQTAVIELLSGEVVLPVTLKHNAPESPRGPITAASSDAYGNHTVDGRKTVNCGVELEVSPELKNGQIMLSGKSTLRRVQQPGAKQPLNAASFATRETYFSDVVTDGQTITIRVGDGPDDKAQITLKIKLIAPKA